mgnify:CR=1 FL=1
MYELCQTIIPDHPVLKDHPEILLHDFEGGKYAVYHLREYRSFCLWYIKRFFVDDCHGLEMSWMNVQLLIFIGR